MLEIDGHNMHICMYLCTHILTHTAPLHIQVLEGDQVLEIDGHNMHRKPAAELSRAVLGPPGTWLTMLLKRQDGSSHTVQLQRVSAQA